MIGIISAMPEEVQSLLDVLKDVNSTTKGMRTYYSGILFNKKVVIVFSRWGKTAAATTATQLINDYPLDEIIFTGVAGAINSSLNIGDIVIGKNLFQHDMDASPFYKQFYIPILNVKYFSTTSSKKLLNTTNSFLGDYNKYIKNKEAENFNITNPKVVIGDIASGDQFISDSEKIKELNQLLPTVTCVEMEGVAVAQVCYEYKIPFSIIRIISDKANDSAEIDFDRFVKSIASNYALGILENYLA